MSRTDEKPAIEIVYDTVKFKQTDFDEYTEYLLPEGLARAAILEELDYFSEKSSGPRRTMLKRRATPHLPLTECDGCCAAKETKLHQMFGRDLSRAR